MSSIGSRSLIDALMMHAAAKVNLTPDEIMLILAAENNGNLEVFKDAGGVNIGYIITANICKYSLLAILRNGILPKYIYEWSEGRICLIHHIFIFPGRSYEAVKALKKTLRKKRAIVYMRNSTVTFLLRSKDSKFSNFTSHFTNYPTSFKRVRA